MVINFGLLVLEMWVLSCIALGLHRISFHFGLTPFIFFIAALVAILRFSSSISPYVRPGSGLTFTIAGNLLIPVILLSVLVLYVGSGTAITRVTIYSIIGISLLTFGIVYAIYKHITIPGGGSFGGIDPDVLKPNGRLAFASIVAFIINLYVISILYQAMTNHLPRIPAWARAGITLIVVMFVNSVVFNVLSSESVDEIMEFLPSDLAGKVISGLLLWPLAAYYLTRVVPGIPGYAEIMSRPTFDLLFSPNQQIRVALTRSEAALRESEARYRQLTENINEVFWMTDPEKRSNYFTSPAYETVWGRSVESLLAEPKSFLESVHPEDKERVTAALPGQVTGDYDIEYRIIRPDGTLRWIRDRAFPVKDAEGKVYRVAGIAEDITERKQLDEKRVELAVTKEKVRALRDFISDATHDLKTPLAAINMKLELVEITTDPEKRQGHIAELHTQIMRMGKLIDNLFTLSRLDYSGELPVKAVDLNQLVTDVCNATRPLAEAKRLTIKLDLEPGLRRVMAEENDLARALTNLLDNAVHYTHEGGLVTARTAFDAGDGWVQVEISDTGIGIAEADLSHIFDRFYRAHKGDRRVRKGTGLGLAIVKKVVDKHHGTIDVSSKVSGGTTFTIRLKAAAED